jgi:hypothetical protein
MTCLFDKRRYANQRLLHRVSELGSAENHTHSFIVRVWLEETAEETGRAIWRGHITHVPSGERRYLKDLGDIFDFILPYLQGMGVKFGILWRVGQCLKGRVRFRWARIDAKPHQEVR